MIREIEEKDLVGLLTLYTHLHENKVPDIDCHINAVWNKILSDEDYHIIVAVEDGKIVSSCTCVIVQNLTRGASSYAVIENVVTDEDYRCRGLATECLRYANSIAEENNCYKMMLITGSSRESTHDFYKKNGYFCDGKTAYYKLLKDVNWNKDS